MCCRDRFDALLGVLERSLRRLGDFHTRFIDRKRVLKLDTGILELSDDGGQLIDLFAEFLFFGCTLR